MTAKECIVDELGQITFRIETNISTLCRVTTPTKPSVAIACQTAIENDIEKLKYLKKKLEIWMDDPPVGG